MKTKSMLLIAIAILTMSARLVGQTDSPKNSENDTIKSKKTTPVSHSISNSVSNSVSNSHSQGGQYNCSYEYNYEYNYTHEVPNYMVKGGLKLNTNLSSFVIIGTPDFQSNTKVGFTFGGFMKADISKNFALQYELLCNYKVSELENKSLNEKRDYVRWGLELPIYAIGQLQLGSGKGFVGVGPYVGVGLASISKPDNADLYKKNKTTNESILNRWDVGLGAMLGYEFKNGITAQVGYQLGFPNMLSAQKDDFSMTTLTASLGIAYRF